MNVRFWPILLELSNIGVTGMTGMALLGVSDHPEVSVLNLTLPKDDAGSTVSHRHNRLLGIPHTQGAEARNATAGTRGAVR
jgi:hypothetical protein